ncbi:MobC protein [Roseibium sp. TrichSKD4]|uniref:GNAT family N-acetyltransferase n=1 Tax=Roseibium sp. TrichSKD4 TaxID=744980 RepID=UPI0001E56EE8|nr:GNAT family N-acetyltransferase [Roseibium sp. TrichSKD4]EFO32203.1 MobC protein [Roseibium sp. TrichSKD4]
MTGFEIRRGFSEEHRERVALLFWQAFSGKLGKVMGPDEKALAFFEGVLNPDFALSAVTADGKLLGMAGYKTAGGALAGGGLKELAKVYGCFGALWRGLLLETLERDLEAETLLMDGIFVSEEARGQGVGSALLDAVCSEAQSRGLKKMRLDVIDTNPRAKSLYERHGFVGTGTVETGPLAGLFGFKFATTMIKRVS